jgi:hypothetical protein
MSQFPRVARRCWSFGLLLPLSLVLLATSPAFAEPWHVAAQPDLAQQIASAKPLPTVDVAQTDKTSRIGRTYLVPAGPGPQDWHLVQIYFPRYGGPNDIILADLKDGSVKKVETPRGLNLHLAPSALLPDGRLALSVLGAKSAQKLCLYDPRTRELVIDAIPLPHDLLGETHPMKLGTDGKLYMAGGHPSKAAAVAQIDPQTKEVRYFTDVGPSHAPADCWAYSVGSDATHTYIASGKTPWYLVALDRATGKSEVLGTTADPNGIVHIRQGRHGVTGMIRSEGTRKEYFLFQGKAIEIKHPTDAPPWAVPEQADSDQEDRPRPEYTLASARVDAQGNGTIWYRWPTPKPADSTKTAAQTPGNNDNDDDDDVVSAPSDEQMIAQGWKPLRYQVRVHPSPADRLMELPDGRLIGTGNAYGGMFIFDPKTAQITTHPPIHLSHYATLSSQGKLYFSGYPSSPLFEYDPAKPWTVGTRLGDTSVLEPTDPTANPRRVAILEDSGCHKMYAAAAAADGTIYMGGRWYRNGEHGGIGWWNPATNEKGGMWRDISNYQVTHLAAVDGGNTIVISGKRSADSVLQKPKPEQGALIFFDHASKQVIGKLEVATNIRGPGPIVAVAPHRLIGWTNNPDDPTNQSSILYGIDSKSRTVAFRKILPLRLPIVVGGNQKEPFDFRLGPDGNIWTNSATGVLLRIEPGNATVHVLGSLNTAGKIAFSGGDVYLSHGIALRRITGLVAAAK